MRRFLVHGALCLTPFLLSDCRSPERGTAPSTSLARASEGSTEPSKEITELESRIHDLEARLAALKERKAAALAQGGAGSGTSGNAASGPLPDPKGIMGLLDKRDAPGVARAFERLLLEGKEGHRVLYEFLHQADLDQPKIVALTHDDQIRFALLRLLVFYPEESASFLSYLLTVTGEEPNSYMRRELLRRFPDFLSYHRDRFPEARKAVEEAILRQLKHGTGYVYESFLAMKALRFEPPEETLLDFLSDPQNRDNHSLAINYLAGRQAEGLRILERFVDQSKDPAGSAVRNALRAMAGMERGMEKGVMTRFLEHKDPSIRKAAAWGYFSLERDARSLQYALDYLNSNDDLKTKRAFLGLLHRQRSKDLLEALKIGLDGIRAEEVKDLVRQDSDKEERPGREKGRRAAGSTRTEG